MLWDKALETGVERIDAQHRELFDRINAILSASMEKRGREKVSETLDFLEDYVVKHFNDEYALQVESGYPKAYSHKLQHDSYVRSLQELKQMYQREGENLNMVLTVNKSIVQWLINHINVHDKEFSAFYREKQGQ